MTLRTLRRGLSALALGLMMSATAAGDDPAPAPPGPAHPAAGPACQNCTKHFTRAGSDCPTCVNGRFGIGFRHRPTVPSLAPGACFGYFPTQWNRWQDVCPIPYPGAGIEDPGNVSTAKKADPKKDEKAETAPPPKPSSDTAAPADPKEKGGELPKPGTLPSIPEAPKGGAGATPPMPNVPMPTIPPAPAPAPAPKGDKP
ncbi:MAG: hypothetical protein K2X87_32825 [Gemmataceae bacterium]|nr:hypothetical protein [Gemmataceae bacterium]